ncbi:MAG: winged helix-turn-helix domain-containing protein [Gammaproteobacteria bacterium]
MKQDADSCTEKNSYQLGEWRFQAALLQLQKGETVVRLQPRVAGVLLELVKNAGRPVSREELMRAVWPNKVVVDEAVSNAIKKLRQSLGDDSQNPRYIETISKVGYRLITDVRVINPDFNYQRKPKSNRLSSRLFDRTWMSFVIIASLIVAFMAMFYSIHQQNQGDISLSQAEPYSVAVLPFENISKESPEEYFTDGITTDIITELSRLRSLKVIGRTTVFTYKGKPYNTREIGKELGVRYIVEGSVQKSRQRLRINVQVADASTGYQLWGEKYDVSVDDLFSVQDELANRIADTLAVQLTPEEQRNLGRPASRSFEAYELFLQGLEQWFARTNEGSLSAAEAYERAIEIDPDFARAYGALAVIQMFRYWRGLTDRPNETRDRALTLAKKAVALDDQAPQTFYSLGYVHLYRREYDHAAEAVANSLSLAPNYADGHGLSAFIDTHIREHERALESIKKAIALNPYYSFQYSLILGRSYYGLGRYSESAEALEESLNRNPRALLPRLFLAATYVRLERIDDAQWEIEQLQLDAPEFTRAQVVKTIPLKEESELNQLLNDLRLAGLP